MLSGCGDIPLPQHVLTFHVESESGEPLSGVAIQLNGADAGQSDAEGLVQAVVRGPEGTSFSATWTCPEGYRAPTAPQQITVRSFQGLDPDSATGLAMTLKCLPASRSVGFVIRTNAQADLPIVLNGTEVARTNAAGVAHYAADAAPGTNFRVQISTQGRALRPQNPSATFTLADADDVFVFPQEFESEEPATPIRSSSGGSGGRRSSSMMRSKIRRIPMITSF
ncbi:MAG: hypothetical protein OEY14_04725 [Myxococcales bacterium]|nr:hypothetical protein [Myxococcales bacterium]